MNDYTIYYGLTFLALIITVGAQIFINAMYSKYKKVQNVKGKSGAEVAREILDKNGLQDIYVVTDHYDPRRKVVRLSTDVYHKESISSVAVAAHECGHAIQDKDNYTFMRVRAALVPFVNFSSYAGYIAIVIGVIAGLTNLIWLGIMFEVVILLFQLVTLPVEIDASKRALKELESMGTLNSEELQNGKMVLISAAMTYVASVATALLELLRLILIYGKRDN